MKVVIIIVILILTSMKSLTSLKSLTLLTSLSKRYYHHYHHYYPKNLYHYNNVILRSTSISSKGFGTTISNNNNTTTTTATATANANANANPNAIDITNNNIKKPEDWDLKGLKAETSRVYLRLFKKIGKASERLSKGMEIYNNYKDSDNLDELEKIPNIDELKDDLSKLQEMLASIGRLEEGLKNVRSNKDSNYIKLVQEAIVLGISDTAPPVQERGPPKPKGKASPPRKPYFVYNSADGVNIRVGRAAPDNDELSCNPEHRDNDDWWLHVAGYAGSHVVIRYTNDDIYEKYKETVLDAAILAAVNSKAPQSGKIPVSLTRCRFVSKPSGAKAGLVRLNGDVMTVKIDVKANQARLDRLNLTKE